MQQFLRIFGAAVLGGLVAGGILIVVFNHDQVLVYPAPAAAPIALPASYVQRVAERPVPVDLRQAARVATPAVVHITSRVAGKRRETVKALFRRDGDNRPFAGGEGSGAIYS
ncbi:MAG: hypothetical protein AAFZ52_11695, partial [Bacteroidota bacterium]